MLHKRRRWLAPKVEESEDMPSSPLLLLQLEFISEQFRFLLLLLLQSPLWEEEEDANPLTSSWNISSNISCSSSKLSSTSSCQTHTPKKGADRKVVRIKQTSKEEWERFSFFSFFSYSGFVLTHHRSHFSEEVAHTLLDRPHKTWTQKRFLLDTGPQQITDQLKLKKDSIRSPMEREIKQSQGHQMKGPDGGIGDIHFRPHHCCRLPHRTEIFYWHPKGLQ